MRAPKTGVASGALTASEYQRWYDYGVLPERLHDDAADELAQRYVTGNLSLVELDDELSAMFGLASPSPAVTPPTKETS